MRRIVGTLVFVFMLTSLLVSAQTQQEDVYYRQASILKIFSHAYGYKILYRKSDLNLGEIYVPKGWFLDSAGKAEIVWGNRPSYPYFSVFWVNGEFAHIRIYAVNNLNSPTWGVLSGGREVRERFEIEELDVEF